MDWIDLAQDRYGWRKLVTDFHKIRGIPWLAENPLDSQEGVWSTKWVSKYTSIVNLFSEKHTTIKLALRIVVT